MGSMFGGGPKGPSLAQKTRDFYTTQAQNQAAAAAEAARQAQAQNASSAARAQSDFFAAQLSADKAEAEKNKLKGSGGFFGLGSFGSGTFLSDGSSRSSFLSY